MENANLEFAQFEVYGNSTPRLLKTKSPGTTVYDDVSTSATSKTKATSTRSYKEVLLG
jgi:hypothetical protein